MIKIKRISADARNYYMKKTKNLPEAMFETKQEICRELNEIDKLATIINVNIKRICTGYIEDFNGYEVIVIYREK